MELQASRQLYLLDKLSGKISPVEPIYDKKYPHHVFIELPSTKIRIAIRSTGEGSVFRSRLPPGLDFHWSYDREELNEIKIGLVEQCLDGKVYDYTSI